MLNEEELYQFIGEITAAEFPTENLSFQVSGKHKIKQIYTKGEDSTNVKSSQDLLPFAGGAEATAVLAFVKLAAGTLLVVKQVWDAWHPKKETGATQLQNPKPTPDGPALKELWKAHLIEAGLPEAKAASIVERFTGELQARLA